MGIISEDAVTQPSLSWYSSTSESIFADLIFNLNRGPRDFFLLGLFSAAFFFGKGFFIPLGTLFGFGGEEGGVGFAFGGEEGGVGFAFGGEGGGGGGVAFGGEGGGGGGVAFGGEGGGGGGGGGLSAILTSFGKACYL